MEFKTSIFFSALDTGDNVSFCLFVLSLLWTFVCSSRDAVALLVFRAVLASTVRFLKAGFAAVVPGRRRSGRSRRRG